MNHPCFCETKMTAAAKSRRATRGYGKYASKPTQDPKPAAGGLQGGAPPGDARAQREGVVAAECAGQCWWGGAVVMRRGAPGGEPSVFTIEELFQTLCLDRPVFPLVRARRCVRRPAVMPAVDPPGQHIRPRQTIRLALRTTCGLGTATCDNIAHGKQSNGGC